ncbi:MAG TPA: hypothetical protein VFZ01_12295 [Geminicoccaceae bacterium]
MAIWTGVLLLAGTGLQASAGPTSYAGPLPRLAAQVPGQDLPDPGSGFAAAAWSRPGSPGPALDFAAASKLRSLPDRGCVLEEADARLHFATAAGPS